MYDKQKHFYFKHYDYQIIYYSFFGQIVKNLDKISLNGLLYFLFHYYNYLDKIKKNAYISNFGDAKPEQFNAQRKITSLL